MIEAVVGLLMFVNGEIKEARLQPSMAICLRGKREAERLFQNQLHTNVGKGKAELEDNIDGSKSIKNSSSNKIAKELKDRRYHQRVVKNKKAYDRKKLHKIPRRDS